MATIKLTITVEKLSNVLTLFDVIKVYRAPVEGGPYVEITTALTRVVLVAGQSVYYYDDTSGDPTFFYKFSYFNSTTLLESSLSEAIQGDADPLYVSIQDIRDEGVPASVTDDRILMLIQTWQAFVERVTRNWFVPRQVTWDFDGNGTALAQFPVPIVSVSELFVNEDFSTALLPEDYLVYNGRGEAGRDDRKNPRIKLVVTRTSIFEGTGPVGSTLRRFLVGEKNQRAVGSFGYIEADGSTPAPIQYVIRRLVTRSTAPMAASAAFGPAGPTIEEETDRHRKKWADPFVASKMWTVTGDPELDQILAMYRAPIVTRAPRTQFRRLGVGPVIR